MTYVRTAVALSHQYTVERPFGIRCSLDGTSGKSAVCLRKTSILTCVQVSEGSTPAPPGYTFGWQRATLLGAFFNGVFLLALGISILVQAIERFINISRQCVAVNLTSHVLMPS